MEDGEKDEDGEDDEDDEDDDEEEEPRSTPDNELIQSRKSPPASCPASPENWIWKCPRMIGRTGAYARHRSVPDCAACISRTRPRQ